MLIFARRRSSAALEGLLVAVIIAMLAALLGLAAAAAASARPATSEPIQVNTVVSGGFKAGTVLVQYKARVPATETSKAERSVGAALVRSLPQVGVRVLRVPPGREKAVVKQLRLNKHVAFAELDSFASATDTTPNDPYYLSQRSTSLAQIKAPVAWDTTTGTSGFLVAVLDSGVSAHADLSGKVTTGYDFVNSDNDPADDNGHGTHVAGIIAAASNNGTGVAGLCWGCKVLPVKVLAASGTGATSTIASGIIYAADRGAKVINLSLGGTTGSTTMKTAIDYAVGKGALVVAATGNQGTASVLYPAAFANVVAVGAVDKYDVLRSYSNTGPEVDLVAPGTNWTTSVSTTSGYAAFSGTSSATPVVASLAALVWSVDPSRTAAQVWAQIEETAVDLGSPGADSSYGHGRVDFAAAVGASGSPTPTQTAAPTATPVTSPSATPSPVPSPTPSATPAPTPTPTAAPTATQAPSPTPAPTATAAPTTTKAWKGSVSARQPTRDYSITVGSGPFHASLASSGNLSLSLLAANGTSVAEGTTATVLETTLAPGTYILRVAANGAKANFKLTATYSTP